MLLIFSITEIIRYAKSCFSLNSPPETFPPHTCKNIRVMGSSDIFHSTIPSKDPKECELDEINDYTQNPKL